MWFESGSTHAFAMEALGEGWPADLYLEGSDQHRGWFNSSLLEAVGTRGRAPFKALLTHGFVLDENGRKMSKSLGNVTAPQEVTDKMGADILRLWTMNADVNEDLRIGPEILKQQSELYRRLRNTLRWLLGGLDGFDPAERLPEVELPELERWVLHQLAEFDTKLRGALTSHDWTGIYPELHAFCSADLSAFYFDIRKDVLYCDAPDSMSRRAVRTVLDHLHRCLTAWLAPVLCFTAEEAWLARFPSDEDSIHLQAFATIPRRLARQGARRALGHAAVAPQPGYDRARTGACREAYRLFAAGSAGVAGRVPRSARRGNLGRDRHRIGSATRFAAGAPRARREMRALLEGFARGRAGSGTCAPLHAVRGGREFVASEGGSGMIGWGLMMALLVFAADQASKYWVLNVLDLPSLGSVPILPVLNLTMVWNPGVTFGLLRQGSVEGTYILSAVALLVVVVLVVWMRKAERLSVALALGAIAGGAVGNVVDRLRFGRVVDFIHAHAFGYSWYVFNVADAAIVCGVGLLILDGMIPQRSRLQVPGVRQ